MKIELKTKIGGGFAVVILLIALLGGMSDAQHEERAGQVADAGPGVHAGGGGLHQLERHARLAMYAMRGFACTEDSKYYQEGQQNLRGMKNHLEEATELAQRSEHLVQLKGRRRDQRASQRVRSISTQTGGDHRQDGRQPHRAGCRGQAIHGQQLQLSAEPEPADAAGGRRRLRAGSGAPAKITTWSMTSSTWATSPDWRPGAPRPSASRS